VTLRAGCRILLAFLIVCAASPAGATDDILGGGNDSSSDTKMLDAYYHRCLNTVYQDQSPETRDEFCSCTSAHMEGTLTYAEIKTMATGKGQPVDNKTLALKVIAPCLAAPLVELQYNACMGDTRYVQFFASQDAYNTTCHCISNGMGEYVQQYATDLLAYLLTQDPAFSKDPADAIRESAQYQEEESNQRNKCLTNNAYQ
jgi:hypothetical protein